MYKLDFDKKFLLKLEAIIDYIAIDNYSKVLEVKDFILGYVKILQYYPFMGRKLDGRYRQIVLPKYKYKIVYKLKNDKITIISIRREQKKF